MVRIDWSRRDGYIRSHHRIVQEWADEAVNDDHAVWLRPDPASRSGHSVRIIGYSRTASNVLTVILVSPEADPSDLPAGDWWGANAWVAGERDRRLYGREEQ